MPGARGRALINSKTRELENKPGEGRPNQAERLPFNFLLAGEESPPTSRLVPCLVQLPFILLRTEEKRERHASFARLARLARFGGAGLEMPARRFHQHRSARSALYILPPPREASASEISTASLISQQRLGRF